MDQLITFVIITISFVIGYLLRSRNEITNAENNPTKTIKRKLDKMRHPKGQSAIGKFQTNSEKKLAKDGTLKAQKSIIERIKGK